MKPIIEGKPSPTPAARIVEVDAESTGQRLDNFLIRHLKGVPKTHVYRIIRSGEVRLNKGRTSADARVAEGDLVRLPPVRVSEKIAEKAERPAPAREFPILLEVTITTGRTHQIRVHLASQGHPIAGDDKYGDFDLNRRLQKNGLKRMFLHAWRLQFDHPGSGERLELRAELPPDLADFLATEPTHA